MTWKEWNGIEIGSDMEESVDGVRRFLEREGEGEREKKGRKGVMCRERKSVGKEMKGIVL